MNESAPTPESAPLPPDRLARPMFFFAFFFLLIVAGLIHRYNRPDVSAGEKWLLEHGLWLGLIFHLEMLYRVFHPHRCASRLKELSRWLLVAIFPPFRMGLKSVSRPNQMWFPFAGWQNVDKYLARKLDRFFAIPMLMFAFLILPIFIIEYMAEERVARDPSLALALHIGISVIWVAFAVEFILKISVAPRTIVYLKERWLDAAIVILPTMEFVLTTWVDAAPLARLLRLSRGLQPQQISKLSRLYRLRGLIMRAWHALLLLEVVGRLIGYSPEKRLKHLNDQLVVKEEEIAEIRAQIVELEQIILKRGGTITSEDNPEAISEPMAPSS